MIVNFEKYRIVVIFMATEFRFGSVKYHYEKHIQPQKIYFRNRFRKLMFISC